MFGSHPAPEVHAYGFSSQPTLPATAACVTAAVKTQNFSHDLQKKMLHDLRQLGINDAPGLGFGCSSSSLGFDTMLLKPM
jgi:hypothetical protein